MKWSVYDRYIYRIIYAYINIYACLFYCKTHTRTYIYIYIHIVDLLCIDVLISLISLLLCTAVIARTAESSLVYVFFPSPNLLEPLVGRYNWFTLPLVVHVLLLYAVLCLQTNHMFAEDHTTTPSLLYYTVCLSQLLVILYHPAVGIFQGRIYRKPLRVAIQMLQFLGVCQITFFSTVNIIF